MQRLGVIAWSGVEKIFWPAFFVVSRLKYAGKFILIGAVFGIPMAVLSYYLITDIATLAVSAEKELYGIRYIAPIKTFLKDVQQHRGAAAAYIGGDGSFESLMMERRADADNDIEVMYRTHRELAVWSGDSGRLDKLAQEWRLIKENIGAFDAEESFTAHTVLATRIIELIDAIKDESGLSLDPDLNARHLVGATLDVIPLLSEQVGQSRAYGLAIPLGQKISTEEKRRFASFYAITEELLKELDYHMSRVIMRDAETRKNTEFFLLHNRQTHAVAMDAWSSGFMETEINNFDKNAYWQTMTAAINANLLFYDTMSPILRNILSERVDRAQARVNFIIILVSLFMILALYIFIGFYLNVRNVVATVSAVALDLSQGRPPRLIGEIAHDELGQVVRNFNNLAESVGVKNQELTGKMVQLNDTHQKLIVARAELGKINANLEKRVAEGTAEVYAIKAELEKRVLDQTRDIQERMLDLEKFKEFAIDRELRMVELKEEIGGLRAELEKQLSSSPGSAPSDPPVGGSGGGAK
jgi:methyl-accepting chemotaxis protein